MREDVAVDYSSTYNTTIKNCKTPLIISAYVVRGDFPNQVDMTWTLKCDRLHN